MSSSTFVDPKSLPSEEATISKSHSEFHSGKMDSSAGVTMQEHQKDSNQPTDDVSKENSATTRPRKPETGGEKTGESLPGLK